VRLFCASGTQWRFAGAAGLPVGLDYTGVEAAARALGVPMTTSLFENLRIMEGAALDELARRRSRGR
jgi:hypothetical protein